MIAVPAHFDGERICLDEPFDLEPNAKLIVTILHRTRICENLTVSMQLGCGYLVKD